jgi:hypothetical protein
MARRIRLLQSELIRSNVRLLLAPLSKLRPCRTRQALQIHVRCIGLPGQEEASHQSSFENCVILRVILKTERSVAALRKSAAQLVRGACIGRSASLDRRPPDHSALSPT